MGLAWWASKARQFRAHVRARVSPAERAALTTWLTPAQLAVFDAMPVADRRHGLDVVIRLRADGVTDAPFDEELLMAGLLHDAGKGPTVGLWPRVAWSLGQAWGSWVVNWAGHLPGFRAALERIRDHAEVSAQMAAAAGCPDRTVELIRYQAEPRDPLAGAQLKRADEGIS
jgi:hypothetical protein